MTHTQSQSHTYSWFDTIPLVNWWWWCAKTLQCGKKEEQENMDVNSAHLKYKTKYIQHVLLNLKNKHNVF